MNIKFPPAGCGRRFVIFMNGDPFAGFDTEKEALSALSMYRDQIRRANAGKWNWELRTQSPQDHLDPCKQEK